jgi:hypothetical protein
MLHVELAIAHPLSVINSHATNLPRSLPNSVDENLVGIAKLPKKHYAALTVPPQLQSPDA